MTHEIVNHFAKAVPVVVRDALLLCVAAFAEKEFGIQGRECWLKGGAQCLETILLFFDDSAVGLQHFHSRSFFEKVFSKQEHDHAVFKYFDYFFSKINLNAPIFNTITPPLKHIDKNWVQLLLKQLEIIGSRKAGHKCASPPDLFGASAFCK